MKSILIDVRCILCHKSLIKINSSHLTNLQKTIEMHKRRLRTPNWSQKEKQYLLELIKEKSKVVINKTNSGPNCSEEKDEAWSSILKLLVMKFGNKFTGSSVKKVKTQWQNMKRIAREEISNSNGDYLKISRQSNEVRNILNSLGVSGEPVEDTEMKETKYTSSEDCPLTLGQIIKQEQSDSGIQLNETIKIDGSSIGCTGDVQVNRETDNNDDVWDSSSTTMVSETLLFDNLEANKENVSECENIITDSPDCENADSIKSSEHRTHPFRVKLNSDLSNSEMDEKKIKLAILHEEHKVIKAMRETAELNKIIAEQQLKQVLHWRKSDYRMYSGEPGSGAGRGGGGGGSIRDAGGSFGKMEAAHENQYFYKQQKQQLEQLKLHLSEEIGFHQEQIKRHEEAIRRHKSNADILEKKSE